MSKTAIDLMRVDRKNAVEESAASETFQIVGGGTFKGVFDRTWDDGNKDKGGAVKKTLRPFIMVNERPAGLTERTSLIQREDETETLRFFAEGKDTEGIPILWLA